MKHGIFKKQSKFRHFFNLLFRQLLHLRLHQVVLLSCVKETFLVIKWLELQQSVVILPLLLLIDGFAKHGIIDTEIAQSAHGKVVVGYGSRALDAVQVSSP